MGNIGGWIIRLDRPLTPLPCIFFYFRLDKFYFLLRRFLSYSFRMLKENEWDLETIEEFSKVMIDGPLK